MNEDQPKQERRLLDNALRRVLRTDSVCRDPDLLRDNVFLVCECFNAFYATVRIKWDILDSQERKKILVKFATDRLGIERCLDKIPELGKLVSVPLEVGELINFKSGKVFRIDSDQRTKPPSPGPSNSRNNSESGDSSEYEEVSSIDSSLSEMTVTMQAVDVIKLVNTTLKPFSGAFEELDPFIVNLEILETAIPAEHSLLGVKCVRGKLQGAAAIFIPPTVTTYAEIISTLKLHIKAETASVVEAKLAAIRFDNLNLSKFSEDVEKAALLLSQTYIHEGIPIPKANEMTIARVTETCRRSARNDLVRSVLASSHFDTPKAVLSKFVTEVADQNKDKQFLALQQQRDPNMRNRGHSGGYRGGSRQSNHYNQGYNHNHNYNSNGRNNYNNRRGSNRSRGNGHYNSNNNSNNNNNPRETYVRVVNEQHQVQEN